jgi:hypothetical protein
VKAGAAGLGGWVALALLIPMEAGVPIPIPADLVMFTVGERVAAGAFPLWLAVIGFEVVSVVGTTALFLACRGPAHHLISRLGPRIGLSHARVSRGATFVETRGRSALAIGRGPPGLRTVTVLAAAASGLMAGAARARRAGGRRVRLLAGPAREARRGRGMGGSGLPRVHRPGPARRPGPRPHGPDGTGNLPAGRRRRPGRPGELAAGAVGGQAAHLLTLNSHTTRTAS